MESPTPRPYGQLLIGGGKGVGGKVEGRIGGKARVVCMHLKRGL